MVNLFDKILRAGEGREVRRLEAIAQRVGEAEDVFTDLSDDELRAETDHFKERLEDGETLDDVMVEAFAAVREAAPHPRPAPVRRADHGRHRPAPRPHRGDEDR